MNFIITSRNVKQGRFASESGASRFLCVPDAVRSPLPEQRVNRRSWVGQVLDAASNTSCGILVFVHGFNVNADEMLESHRNLEKNLESQGFDGVLLSYDWPSAGVALNYLEDRSDAKQTALRLVNDCLAVFSNRQQPDCSINLHVLAHSAGAYLLREAFDDADDRRRLVASNWTVSQILLVAADVSSCSLRETDPRSASLYRHALAVTNYASSYDTTLKLSNVKRLGTATRAGRSGLPNNSPAHALNIDCGDYFQSLPNDTNSHSWYLTDPLFAKDAVLTLIGDIERRALPTRKPGPTGPHTVLLTNDGQG